MFLDTFCNDSQGWGPHNSHNNDLTPCAQGWLIFMPINLIFIILALIHLCKILQTKGESKALSIQHRSSMPTHTPPHTCNIDLILSFLFALGFSYALCTAIILQSTKKRDHLNWLIFTLSFEIASWIIYTFALYMERRRVIIYGIGEAPSNLVRWFWIAQWLLSLKQFESVMVAKYSNHTQPINFEFYIQTLQIIPFTLLFLRAVLVQPTQIEIGMGYDSQSYPSKLSLQQYGTADNDDMKQATKPRSLDDQSVVKAYPKTAEENANFFNILTFNWLNPVFVTGYKRALEMTDLSYLKSRDHSHETLKLFCKAWRAQLQSARDKNERYALKHGNEEQKSNDLNIQQSSDRPIQVISTDNSSNNKLSQPLLKRQQSDQGTMPAHIRVDESAKYKPSLLKAILSAFGSPILVAAPLKLIYDCFQYSGPLLLSAYLTDATKFDSGDKSAVSKAYMYAGLLFFVYMACSFILAQYFHRLFRTGMRVRSALMCVCYEKALKLTQGARSERTQGELMNIVTVDVRKIRDVFPYCCMLISAPFQITVAIYLLYQQIGWSVFMGLALQLVFMAPLQMLVMTNARKLQKLVMKKRDKRMEVINEVFGAMKIVKMYAWEGSFGNKITNLRNEELAILRCYIWWFSLMALFWGFAPTLVALTSFLVYVAAGHSLTATSAFTSIALFNLLRFPLAILPMVIIAFVEANVCLGRIRKFLCANEIDPNIITYAPMANQELIKLENVTATWDDEMNQIALNNINASFVQNSITMVIGETGSGKSALLRTILGNLTKSNGNIMYGESPSTRGQRIKIAYSSQVAWIRNATVKDNILFDTALNEDLYNEVIQCCALTDDLKILPGGDKTEIGEKGITLSGGQKQRVSLARAVYSNADVYILDDPLSAVDAHVGNQIFNECLLGLLKEKTIILATHAVSFLKYADNIIVMESGEVKLEGKLQDLYDANINLTKFIIQKDKDTDSKDETEDSESKEDSDETSNESSKLSKKSDKKSDKKKGELTKEEERGVGNVSFEIYYLYVKAAGGIILFLGYILCLAGFYGSTQFGNFWLAFLSDQKFKDRSDWWYMDIYCAIQGMALIALALAVVVGVFTRLNASKHLFERLLAKQLRSPMSFFDTTPIGRIINRFSRDIYAVDSAIPNSYRGAMRITIGLVSTTIGVCVVTPWFALSMLPLSVLYYYLQKYFIAASRELRRLSTLMNSPIYSNFSESVAGVDLIKAFDKSLLFSNKNQEMIDKDHQAYYPSVAGNRWLAIRLEFIGNCMIGLAALFCAVTQPPAGYIGVALSTIMSVTQGLNYFVRNKAQLEQDIVSVERIDQYSNDTHTQESAAIIEQNRPPKIWPNHGNIVFNNVWMKYRAELDYVLKGLSFEIVGGEKVGVIGRTGAGKSSLFVTLLRIVEIEKVINDKECEIVIDGVNIAQIGLKDLRSRISIIPQDPVLFTGTIRFNLDPFEVVSDEHLIEALKHSHIYDALKKMTIELAVKKERDEMDKQNKDKNEKSEHKSAEIQNKNNSISDFSIKSVSKIDIAEYLHNPKYRDLNPLDITVEENGSNFSVGQRQLLCLARAIVRKSKILLLDEATSAVDMQTDQFIQATIRQEFKANTILTIAHRIDTILDYDKILIMNEGSVLEYAAPQTLLANESSKFSEIVQESFGVNLNEVLKNKMFAKGKSGFGDT